MSVNGQIHVPVASPSTPSGGKKTRYPGGQLMSRLLYPVAISGGTHRVVGWVGGYRAGMDVAVKRRF